MKRVLCCLVTLAVCLSVGVSSVAAQARGNRAPADPQEALRRQLTKQLRGGENSYFTLALMTTEAEVDAVGGVIGFTALSVEMLFAPLTIAEGSRGNRDIRPGALLEKVPPVKPTTYSHEVDVVVLKGKDATIEAILEHLSGPAERDGKNRAWSLVKRTSYRKVATDAGDKLEKELREAARRADIKVTRKPDPA